MQKVLLLSTYDLGRLPFALFLLQGRLEQENVPVKTLDLSLEELPIKEIDSFSHLCFYTPMHTATRLALKALEKIKGQGFSGEIAFFGHYADLNKKTLMQQGIHACFGGEYEDNLVRWILKSSFSGKENKSPKGDFALPSNPKHPPLKSYGGLQISLNKRLVLGHVETSRGCLHHCRHCPIPPVYGGRFSILPRQLVISEICRQVKLGAQHITLGDPDFFNGPLHGLRILEEVHQIYPHITFDVTIKIEHLLKHRRHLPKLKEVGCIFVISALESFDNQILKKLQKGHTYEDFLEAREYCRKLGLILCPTFIPFTPWTTREGYRDFLKKILTLDLVPALSPVQYTLRLLIHENSGLLELKEIQDIIQPFDQEYLYYPWSFPDPWLEDLQKDLELLVWNEQKKGASSQNRWLLFQKIWNRAIPETPLPAEFFEKSKKVSAFIPYLTEPWYC